MIDHQHRHLRFLRFQLEPQLLLDRREQRRQRVHVTRGGGGTFTPICVNCASSGVHFSVKSHRPSSPVLSSRSVRKFSVPVESPLAYIGNVSRTTAAGSLRRRLRDVFD